MSLLIKSAKHDCIMDLNNGVFSLPGLPGGFMVEVNNASIDTVSRFMELLYPLYVKSLQEVTKVEANSSGCQLVMGDTYMTIAVSDRGIYINDVCVKPDSKYYIHIRDFLSRRASLISIESLKMLISAYHIKFNI